MPGRYKLGLRTALAEVVITDWNAMARLNCQNFNVRIDMIDDASPDDFFKPYGWKLPCAQDGTRITYRDGNLVPADDQANIDEIILQAKLAGGTVYGGFYWPDDSLITDGNSNWVIQSGIRLKLRKMYMGFRNSVNRLNKFVIQAGSLLSAWDHNASAPLPPPANTGGTWLNFDNMLNDWILQAQDPTYWYSPSDARTGFRDRPVLMLFQDPTPSWDAARITTIRNGYTGAGLPNPIILMNTLAAATTCGADGTYNYCGPNKTGFGSTHRPFSQEITNLESFFGESTAGSISLPSVCTTNDGRPRGASANDVDASTYIQAETVIRHARDYAVSQISPQVLNAILFANLGEYDESSVIGATPQVRLLGAISNRGPYLDAIQNVLNKSYPDPIVVVYSGRTLHADVTRVGTWTLVQNLIDGGTAYEYEEMQSNTAGDTWTISPALACDRFWIYGSIGPAYGTANAIVNGGAPTLCTQTNGSIVRTYNNPPDPKNGAFGNPIFDSGDLTPGANTCQMQVVAGLLGIDMVLVRITANRI